MGDPVVSIFWGKVVARNADGTYQLLAHGAEHPYGSVPGLAGCKSEVGDQVPYALIGGTGRRGDTQMPQIINRGSRSWRMGSLPVADAWPTYCHDGGCSSNNPAAAAAWTLALDSTWTAVPYLATGPVATSNALLFQTSSSDPSGVRLVLRDIATQANRWALPWSGSFNHPSVHGDAVYCFDGSSLFKLSLADGAVVWTATSFYYGGVLLFDDARGCVYVARVVNSTAYVSALAQSDGSLLWSREVPNCALRCTFSGDRIQLSRFSEDHSEASLIALDPSTGGTSWETTLTTESGNYRSTTGYHVSLGGVTAVPVSQVLNVSPWTATSQLVGVSSSGSVLWRHDFDTLPPDLYGAGTDWFLVGSAYGDYLQAVSSAGAVIWTLSPAGIGEGGVGYVACALAGDTALVTTSVSAGGNRVVKARTVTRSGSSSSWSTISTGSDSGDLPANQAVVESRLILVGASAYYWNPVGSLVRIV